MTEKDSELERKANSIAEFIMQSTYRELLEEEDIAEIDSNQTHVQIIKCDPRTYNKKPEIRINVSSHVLSALKKIFKTRAKSWSFDRKQIMRNLKKIKTWIGVESAVKIFEEISNETNVIPNWLLNCANYQNLLKRYKPSKYTFEEIDKFMKMNDGEKIYRYHEVGGKYHKTELLDSYLIEGMKALDIEKLRKDCEEGGTKLLRHITYNPNIPIDLIKYFAESGDHLFDNPNKEIRKEYYKYLSEHGSVPILVMMSNSTTLSLDEAFSIIDMIKNPNLLSMENLKENKFISVELSSYDWKMIVDKATKRRDFLLGLKANSCSEISLGEYAESAIKEPDEDSELMEEAKRTAKIIIGEVDWYNKVNLNNQFFTTRYTFNELIDKKTVLQMTDIGKKIFVDALRDEIKEIENDWGINAATDTFYDLSTVFYGTEIVDLFTDMYSKEEEGIEAREFSDECIQTTKLSIVNSVDSLEILKRKNRITESEYKNLYKFLTSGVHEILYDIRKGNYSPGNLPHSYYSHYYLLDNENLKINEVNSYLFCANSTLSEENAIKIVDGTRYSLWQNPNKKLRSLSFDKELETANANSDCYELKISLFQCLYIEKDKFISIVNRITNKRMAQTFHINSIDKSHILSKIMSDKDKEECIEACHKRSAFLMDAIEENTQKSEATAGKGEESVEKKKEMTLGEMREHAKTTEIESHQLAYCDSSDVYTRESLAQNPKLTSKVQVKLAKDGATSVRNRLAINSNLYDETQLILASDKIVWIQENLARAKCLSKNVQEILAKSEKDSVRSVLAWNEATDIKTKKILAEDSSDQVLCGIAASKIPEEIQIKLVQSKFCSVRIALSENKHITEKVKLILADDKDSTVRSNLTFDSLTEEIENKLINDEDSHVIYCLARKAKSEEVIKKLIEKSSKSILKAMKTNPNLTESLLKKVIEKENSLVIKNEEIDERIKKLKEKGEIAKLEAALNSISVKSEEIHTRIKDLEEKKESLKNEGDILPTNSNHTINLSDANTKTLYSKFKEELSDSKYRILSRQFIKTVKAPISSVLRNRLIKEDNSITRFVDSKVFDAIMNLTISSIGKEVKFSNDTGDFLKDKITQEMRVEGLSVIGNEIANIVGGAIKTILNKNFLLDKKIDLEVAKPSIVESKQIEAKNEAEVIEDKIEIVEPVMVPIVKAEKKKQKVVSKATKNK